MKAVGKIKGVMMAYALVGTLASGQAQKDDDKGKTARRALRNILAQHRSSKSAVAIHSADLMKEVHFSQHI
eukprot:10934337-Karenia_brevis.AAC.1